MRQISGRSVLVAQKGRLVGRGPQEKNAVRQGGLGKGPLGPPEDLEEGGPVVLKIGEQKNTGAKACVFLCPYFVCHPG